MEKYCIGLDYTIKEAIDRINASGDRVALVLGKESKLVGVISQGDIIRALSSGKNLYARIDSIIRTNFFYINERDMEKAYKLFKNKNITLLPIVDDEFHIIDVINVHDIYGYLEERCKN